MSHNSLSRILKAVTVITAVLGIIICFVIIPLIDSKWWMLNGKNVFWQWAVFLWIAAVPCFIALWKFWGICTEIARDNSFSDINAVRLKHIAVLALVDSIYVFCGNIVLFFLDMNTLAAFILLFIVDFIGIAISIGALTLSRLISKAADMRKENELTI